MFSLIRTMVVASGFAAAAFSPVAAHSEVFVDIYGGKGWTTRTNLSLHVDDATINSSAVPVDVRVDIDGLNPKDSESFGARIGFWSGVLGVALDASTLNPDLQAKPVRASANVQFDETVFGRPISVSPGETLNFNMPDLPLPTTATIAALAMVRIPVGKTQSRKAGLIQPYAFAGPVWLVTNKRFDGKIGLRVGGGAKLAITRNLGIFGEYRYTAVDGADIKAGSFSGSYGGVSGSTGAIIGSINLRTHAVVAGASLSF